MSQISLALSPNFSSPTDFVANIENELPPLLESIRQNNSNESFSSNILFLYGENSVMRNVSIQEINQKLLQPTLPTFKEIFTSNLSKILNILEESEESSDEVYCSLSEILQVDLEILGAYASILDYITTESCLKCGEIESLLTTLPGLLLESFNHCQGSENNYGSYFSNISELLSALFKKSYELSNLLNKILDDHVVFDCTLEHDTSLLITVLEILSSTAEIVVSLDVKALVDQWKGIAKLLTKYAEPLKERLNLYQPMKFLISQLQTTIDELNNNKDECKEKHRLIKLKVGCFLLKVVVKLCEVYSGYLDLPIITELISLLLLLNRCSRLLHSSLNEELERFIVVGAGPLLAHLSKERQFFEIYKNRIEKLDSCSPEETIGFFYTHLRLFKFLINCTEWEEKEKWFELPLIQVIIQLFRLVSPKLDFTIAVDGLDSYTSLVSTAVAFLISNFTSDQFLPVEKFLFSQLFEPDIEVGILISDLLALLCRLTNEDVCLRQTRYLFMVLSLPTSYSSRPEVCLARCTASRLYSMLSITGQEMIQKEFPLHLHAWRHVELTNVEESSCSLVFNAVQTPQDFMNTIEKLHLLCHSAFITRTLSNEKLIEDLRRTLQGFQYAMKTSEKQSSWWNHLFYLFTKIISFITSFLTPEVFEEVIEAISALAPLGKPATTYYIVNMLIELTTQKTHLPELNDVITRCFSNLSSDSVLLKIIIAEKLSSLDDLGCINVLIDEEIRNYVAMFTNSTFNQGNANVFGHGINFVHKCFLLDYDSVEYPPIKKIKTDPPISEEVSRLKEVVDNVVKYSKKIPFSSEESQIVKQAIFDLSLL